MKRRNANGSKTPPQYQSREKSEMSPIRKGNSFVSSISSNYNKVVKEDEYISMLTGKG